MSCLYQLHLCQRPRQSAEVSPELAPSRLRKIVDLQAENTPEVIVLEVIEMEAAEIMIKVAMTIMEK